MIINFLFITLKKFISMIFNNFIMIIIMIIIKIYKFENTHSWILKLDFSTQASSRHQATISLMSCCCNKENSNQQHTDDDDK